MTVCFDRIGDPRHIGFGRAVIVAQPEPRYLVDQFRSYRAAVGERPVQRM